MTNQSQVVDSNTWTALISNVNDASNGYFGLSLIFALFLITFVLFMKRGTGDLTQQFFASSFITVICCIFAYGFGMIGGTVLTFWVVILGGTMLKMYFSKS